MKDELDGDRRVTDVTGRDQRHQATRWGAKPFVALMLVGFLGRLGYEMLRSPVSALYARHLGAPLGLVGLIVASATISGIFVKLPSGALADIFGFKRLIVIGSVVKATGPFLYFAARVWEALIPVRLFHGLATAIYAPAASALVAAMYPAQRARRLGIYSAAENTGIVLGPALGGFVLAVASYDAAFLVAGVIGIAALGTALLVPNPGPAAAPEAGDGPPEPVLRRLRAGISEIVHNPPVLATGLVEAVMFSGFGTLQAYLPLYASGLHFGTGRIGLLFAAQGVTSIAGRPMMGAASDRLGRRPLIVAGLLVAAASVAATTYVSGYGLLLIVSAGFGLGLGAVTPSTTSLIADLTEPRQYGAAMGVFGSIWDTGHAGGPLIAGALVAGFGYHTAFVAIAALMVSALAVFLTISARSARSRPPATE